jgi:O-antigen/teichoic acid export membrane protein
LVLILNALAIIQQNQLQKQLEFKKLAIVHILSSIISLVIAIVTAMSGWGVWSLVAQQISLSSINSFLLILVTKWKPQRLFSLQAFRSLFKFGGFILLSNLFSTLANEIQGLLIGRMFAPSTLGYYNQAYRLEGSAANTVSSVLNQVTYPVMSSLQDNRQKLQSALRKFTQVPAFFCCPIMAFLIVAANPIIVIIYSEKWVDSVPYLQILCIAGVAVCLQGAANQAITAIGKSDVFFRWTIIKRTLTIILSVVGIFLAGMKGLLWFNVIGAWAVYVINGCLVEKYIGYSLYRQFMDILPYMILSSAIGVLTYYLSSFLDINLYLMAGIQLISIVTLYLAFCRILKLESFSFIVGIIKERLIRR